MKWTIGKGISPFIRSGGGTSWSSYWLTREPSNLVATVVSSTGINLTWDDAAEASDGLKIYLSTDGGVTYTYNSTIAYGVEAKSLTGLTNGTEYYIKLVAYKGVNESNAVITHGKISTLLIGLADYWKFNEANGNAAGVNGNTLVNNNTATYGAGKIGNCGDLGSGNTNKSFTCDSAFGMTYQSSRSYGGWIKINSQPALNTTVTLFSMMFGTNPGNYQAIQYKDVSTAKRLQITGVGTYVKVLTTGTWYHIMVVIDYAGDTVKLYLDGILVISATDLVANSDLTTYASRFAVGNFIDVQQASVAFDEIGLWSKVLSGDEVVEHFNVTEQGISHLFSYFKTDRYLSNSAYLWFTKPQVVYDSSVSKSFIGTQHHDGTNYTQHIAEIDHTTGLITANKIGTAYLYDDHSSPAILQRSSDKRLITFYSYSVAGALKYRISTNPSDSSAWEAETTLNPNNPSVYVYPNIFEVANGDIYVFYIDISAHPYQWAYIKSVDGGVNFGADTLFTNNIRYSLLAQDSANKDIIHFITSPHPWIGEATPKQTHYYFDAGDGTYHKSDGTDITADVPLDYTDGTTVFSNTDPAQGWIEDIIIDSNGYPRVLMTYHPDIDATPHLKMLMYSEWTGLAWTAPYQIHQSMNRSIATDIITDPSVQTYPPLARFDKANPDRIFAGKEISDGGQLEIYELVRVAANNFTSTKKTTSNYDQWRPFTSNAPTYNVFWLNKIRYTHYANDFNQELICRTL